MTNKVTIRPVPPFGDAFSLPIPDGCNVVILCTNSGTGLVPRRLVLPHQVYLHTAKALALAHAAEGRGGGPVEVVAVPARSCDYITLPLPKDETP